MPDEAGVGVDAPVAASEQPWTPISGHALIGDLRTCALIDTEGTLDWFCAGRFDAPSVFAALLDPAAGSWTMTPIDGATRTQQFYLPDSAVLITRLLTEEGVAEVQDVMPVVRPDDADHRQRIVRRVVGVRGRTRVRTCLDVRPDYARQDAEFEPVADGFAITAGPARMVLTATADLRLDDGRIGAEIVVEEGECSVFVLEVLDGPDDAVPTTAPDADEVEALYTATVAFWREWLDRSTYRGRWREMVHRSAITLKLLTHEPTGAVIAAPTTSLPEEIGGGRNWDYRFVWIRDAAFSIYALLRLGFTDEAGRFVEWLSQRVREGHDQDDDLGPLRVAYDIDGAIPDEVELDQLRGYRDSRPVRVGNAATTQLQLDIYGELIDSIYLYDKYGSGIGHDVWSDLRRLLEWLMENWERDDAGMWEIRGDLRPHTTSRLMSWVAVERMMRTARKRGLPGDVAAWGRTRDAIYERIMSDSWDDDAQTFTQRPGDPALDAGLLLMPMVKFVAPTDPRFVSTLRAIEERLVHDSLVCRYDLSASPDGVEGGEGSFSLCSFWYVEALTHVGRLDEARLALEKMFTYANHVGLYAEQIGFTGDQLGNFPQALTHLSLISAATNLDRALSD